MHIPALKTLNLRRIWFDLDGILFNFLHSALPLIAAASGKPPLKEDEITSHDYLPLLGIDKDLEHRAIDGASDFWENLPPYPTGLLWVRILQKANIPYGFITNPGTFQHAHIGKTKALTKHGLLRPDTPLIFAKNKGDLLKTTDLLIDDYALNCAAAQQNGAYAICPTRTWNISNPENFPTTDDSDITQLLREYASYVNQPTVKEWLDFLNDPTLFTNPPVQATLKRAVTYVRDTEIKDTDLLTLPPNQKLIIGEGLFELSDGTYCDLHSKLSSWLKARRCN